MVIPPGFEPGIPPWKSDVLTSWPRDHIQGTIKKFSTPKKYKSYNQNIAVCAFMKFGEPGEIRTPGPLIKSQLRYQLRHRLRYIRRLFCRQQALSPSRKWIFVSCSTRQGTQMLTGQRVVYLCAFFPLLAMNGTSCISSNFWFSFLQLLPIRESKPNSLLEPPITNRNAVIFIG